MSDQQAFDLTGGASSSSSCPHCGRPFPEFDRPGDSHRDAPAHGVDRIRRGGQKHTVLDLLSHFAIKGRTSHECDVMLGWPDNKSAKRMTELAKDGAVYHTDETRPNGNGSSAWVWRITQAGLDRLAELDQAKEANQ